jgi:hypothetical protein
MAEFSVKTHQGANLGFESGALAAEFLRALGIVPNVGLFQLTLDLGQAMLFGLEVKDTPV